MTTTPNHAPLYGMYNYGGWAEQEALERKSAFYGGLGHAGMYEVAEPAPVTVHEVPEVPANVVLGQE